MRAVVKRHGTRRPRPGRSPRSQRVTAAKRIAAASLGALLLAAAPGLGGVSAPARAASFDCAKATQPLDRRICQDSELSHMDEDLAAKYAKARAPLSPQGQKLLQEGQRDWLAFSRRICKTRLDAKVAEVAEQTPEQCLKSEYQERLDDLDSATVELSGFLFQRIDLYGLAVDDSDPEMPHGTRAGFSYRRISFPRIDRAPAGIDPAGWNRMVAIAAQKMAASGDGDDGAAAAAAADKAPGNIVKPDIDQAEAADIDVFYDFGLVTPQMISLNLTYGVYGHGAAHPSGFTETHNILLGERRELTAKDLFKEGSDWQRFLAERSRETWVEIMEGAAADVDDKAIADVVRDPQLWQLSDKGLAVFFPLYSVGPYVAGEQQVEFTWEELKPYLADKLPFPLPGAAN